MSLAVPEEVAVLVGVRAVADDPGVPHVVVARPARAAEHLEDVEGAHVHLALQGVVEFGVADDDAARRQIDPHASVEVEKRSWIFPP